MDKAVLAGYTGVVLWDSSFNFMGNASWPAANEDRMRTVMKYAVNKRLNVLAPVAPFGWSNDILLNNPNWAEAQRIVGAPFQVDPSGKRLNFVNSFAGLANPGFESGKAEWFDLNDSGVGINSVAHTGKNSAVIVDAPGNARLRQQIFLTPWRQYHLRLFFKSKDFRGSPMLSVLDAADSNKVRLTANLDAKGTHAWTQLDYTFNSQNSTNAYLYLGVWGGSSGLLWFDDIQIEETALVYLARRAGTPLKIYNPDNIGTLYREGADYNFIADPHMAPGNPFHLYDDPPGVTLPAGTGLRPGQTVAMDFYSVFPIPISNQVGMCLTEPGVYKWLKENAQALKRVLPAGSGIFLGYDEMRQMNSCASCRAKNMTAGELLAWSVEQTARIYQSAIPGAPLYIWSDMFDPYHNATQNFYYVEGDIAGSWKALPAGMTIMNWNVGKLKQSLTWFSGLDRRQPVPHNQIIAGYYDTGDGASAAQQELAQAAGIPGVAGLMYTTYNDDYSQLQSFAAAAKSAWSSYLSSLTRR